MARYAYDVNTQTKLLDIHKQFQGGLKTVDTDDSLKTLYLRKAENLEISEFGFLEKRYGQNIHQELIASGLTSTSNIQGYFEYKRDDNTIDKIIIIDGKLFLSINGASFTQVTYIKSESGKRIPDPVVFATLGMDVNTDFYTITDTLPLYGNGRYVYPTYNSLPTPSPQGGDLGYTAWVLDTNSQYVVDLQNDWVLDTSITFDMDLLKQSTSSVNYYYKKNTTYYTYAQVPGENYYQFTFVASPDFADADFQTTRPVEGTRLDDTLYIFTGTYPITYRGDGNFYLLDIYKPNFTEVVELSHNLLENNYENVYLFDKTLSVTNNAPVTSGNLITKKEFDYKPDLPYNTGTGSGFQFKYSYDYRNDLYLEQGDFDLFLDTDSGHSSEHDLEVVSSTHIPSNSVLVELFPIVYTRDAGGGEAEWKELNKDFYNAQVRTNADVNSLFNVGEFYEDSVVYQEDYTLSGYSFRAINQTTPFDVTITKLPLGNIDLRIEFVYVKSGYTDLAGGSSSAAFYRFEQVKTVVSQEDYLNMFVSEEKLEDYNDYPLHNGYPDIWSANRVIPHYGKLLVYGSLGAPQNLYISHPTYRNYFPAYFYEEFTTEERDPIVKVAPFQNILVIMSEDYIWGLKGVDALPDSTNPYSKFTISPLYGTIAPETVRPVRNYLMFLSKEGIMQLVSLYAVDEQYNVKPADENIRNLVPTIEDDKYDPTKAVAIQFDDQYWIHFPDKLDANKNNMVLRYYADKRAWMKDTYFTTENPESFIFKGIHKWIRRTGSGLHYITQPYKDGATWKIDEIALDYYMPSDLGKDIQTIMETAYLEQNYPFHPKLYKEAKLEFTIQNEYNASLSPLFPEVDVDNTKADFDAISAFDLRKNHTYRFDFGRQLSALFTITIDGVTYNTTLNAPTPPAGGQQSYYYEFVYTGDTGSFDITINVGASGLLDTDIVTLSNITYDDSINYYVWVLSEENTLNLDNLTSYNAELALNTENLGTKTGTWVFGETDFGNRVQAVQTVRLSGKGKNIKLYLEELSKSKWTLESLGFMYKLRRARGNR